MKMETQHTKMHERLQKQFLDGKIKWQMFVLRKSKALK